MTTVQVSKWEGLRTPESRIVEEELRKAGFDQVDAYRYNSASLRVRVVDPRFEAIDRDQRDLCLEPFLEKLPAEIQADIVSLVLLAPSELKLPHQSLRELILNSEFENPSPSML